MKKLWVLAIFIALYSSGAVAVMRCEALFGTFYPFQPFSSSYYERLSIDESASLEDIKKAYRKAAMQLHPERLFAVKGVIDDGEAFKNIKVAYERLSVSAQVSVQPLSRSQYTGYDRPVELKPQDLKAMGQQHYQLLFNRHPAPTYLKVNTAELLVLSKWLALGEKEIPAEHNLGSAIHTSHANLAKNQESAIKIVRELGRSGRYRMLIKILEEATDGSMASVTAVREQAVFELLQIYVREWHSEIADFFTRFANRQESPHSMYSLIWQLSKTDNVESTRFLMEVESSRIEYRSQNQSYIFNWAPTFRQMAREALRRRL